MFFIGIFGIQDKINEVKEYNNVICSCGRYSKLKLIEEYTYFHIFFIPVFKWGRKYLIEARCCGRVFRVPEDYVHELLNSETVDVSRLEEVAMPYRLCGNCGQYVDSGYKFCPHCGKEL